MGVFNRWDHWAFELGVMLLPILSLAGLGLVAAEGVHSNRDPPHLGLVLIGDALALLAVAGALFWWRKSKRDWTYAKLAWPFGALVGFILVAVTSVKCPPEIPGGGWQWCFEFLGYIYAAWICGAGILATIAVWWLRGRKGRGDGAPLFATIVWNLPAAFAAAWATFTL